MNLNFDAESTLDTTISTQGRHVLLQLPILSSMHFHMIFSVSSFQNKSKSDEFSIRTRLCADVSPQICFISGVCKIHIIICICTKCNNCISDLQVTKAKKLIKLGADDFYEIQIFSIFYFISEFPDFTTLQIFYQFSTLRYTLIS